MDGTFSTELEQMISGGLKRFARQVHGSLLANWNSDLRAQQAANAWLPICSGTGKAPPPAMAIRKNATAAH